LSKTHIRERKKKHDRKKEKKPCGKKLEKEQAVEEIYLLKGRTRMREQTRKIRYWGRRNRRRTTQLIKKKKMDSRGGGVITFSTGTERSVESGETGEGAKMREQVGDTSLQSVSGKVAFRPRFNMLLIKRFNTRIGRTGSASSRPRPENMKKRRGCLRFCLVTGEGTKSIKKGGGLKVNNVSLPCLA